jgi:hypothetical protein
LLIFDSKLVEKARFVSQKQELAKRRYSIIGRPRVVGEICERKSDGRASQSNA